MSRVVVVDADELDAIARAMSDAHNDIYWIMAPLNAGQYAVPWQSDTHALWESIRTTVDRELPAIDADARGLRDRANRARMEAAQAAWRRILDLFSSLAHGGGDLLTQVRTEIRNVGVSGQHELTAISRQILGQLHPIVALVDGLAPVGVSQVYSRSISVTLPGAEIGIPASGEITGTRTVRIVRNADGSTTVEIIDTLEGDAVEDLIPGAEATVNGRSTKLTPTADAKVGGKLVRVYEFTFAKDEDLEQLAVLGTAAIGSTDDVAALAALYLKDLVHESTEFAVTGEAEAGVEGAGVDIAGVKASGEVGGGLAYDKTANGLHEMSVDLNASMSAEGTLLDFSSKTEVSASIANVAVQETGKSFTRVTIELKATESGNLLSFKDVERSLNLHGSSSVDAFNSIKIEIETDRSASDVQMLLKSGGARSLIGDGAHSHVVITGSEGANSTFDLGGKVTAAPSQTIGGDVRLSAGTQRDTVLYDNGYTLQAETR